MGVCVCVCGGGDREGGGRMKGAYGEIRGVGGGGGGGGARVRLHFPVHHDDVELNVLTEMSG